MAAIRADTPVAAIDRRRAVAVVLPLAIPALMTGTFVVARDHVGDHLGYVAGFSVYWAACAGLSVAILGRRGVARLFADNRPRLGEPVAIGAVLLMWPIAGAVTTRLMPELSEASAVMLTTSVAVALANSVLEEVLWRGVYISLWPENLWLGWIWPALGFGAWHLAPQVIHPSSLGPLAYVAAATTLGLSWGWVAWRTRSLRWVSVSHFFTDASGLRNALFFLGT